MGDISRFPVAAHFQAGSERETINRSRVSYLDGSLLRPLLVKKKIAVFSFQAGCYE